MKRKQLIYFKNKKYNTLPKSWAFLAKKLFFYWLIKLKWISNFKINFMYKMPILFFQVLIFEKNFLNILNLKKAIFTRSIMWTHNKINSFKFFRFFFFFSGKIFPYKKKKSLVKTLLRFWENVSLYGKFNYLKWAYFNSFKFIKWSKWSKKKFYIVSEYGHFDKINFFYSLFEWLKKNIFSKIKKKKYFIKSDIYWFKRFTKKFFLARLKKNSFTELQKYVTYKRRISRSISKKLKFLLMDFSFLKKLDNYKKKHFTFFFVRSISLKWIFFFENFVFMENLLFWKSIINWSLGAFSFLSEKGIFPYTLEVLVKFLFTWHETNTHLTIDQFPEIASRPSELYIKHNFGGIRTIFYQNIVFWFEKFLKTQTFYIFIDVFYWYLNSYKQQKNFLPRWIKNSVDWILEKIYENQFDKNLDESYAISLANTNVLDYLFFFLFWFSLSKLITIWTKFWNFISHCYQKIPTYPRKNWNYLNFFSIWGLEFWKWGELLKRYGNTTFKIDKKLISDHFFFYWKISSKYIKKKEILKKSVYFNSLKYNTFHRFSETVYTLWSHASWWVFYLKNWAWYKWFWRWEVSGEEKLSYEVISDLQTQFWSDFFFFKNSSNSLLTYSHYFYNGMYDLGFFWKFSVSFLGLLKFKHTHWKDIARGRNTVLYYDDWKYRGTLRWNSLFLTFFSFLSWIYLLSYMLQFGHTKSMFNTTYKHFIVMVYNKRFIINLLAAQVNLKWNLRIIFKMFYMGGAICLVSSFNILLEGLISLYGAYSKQPCTRYIWVNGLVSNFDKVYKSFWVWIMKAYSAKLFFSKKSIWWLLHLWFCAKGILTNLAIDISFLPSVWTSHWVFLEHCARFYPTIGVNNTTAFVAPPFLDYYLVANDYSLLTLSFYINLVLTSFKKSKLMWKLEFCVYPQKLISEVRKFQLLPTWSYFLVAEIHRQYWKMFGQFKRVKFMFLERNWDILAYYFKYFLFIKWEFTQKRAHQIFWWYFYFTNYLSKLYKINP